MKIGMRRLQLFILLFAASSLLLHSPSDFEAFAASPSDIGAADAVTDEDTDSNGGTFDSLTKVRDVSTFTIGSSTYAIAVGTDGVQMIDISDPTNILAIDAVADGDTDSNGDTFSMLGEGTGVSTFTIGSSTYAIVTANEDDGVQMIDISDPTNILAIDAMADGDTDSNGDTFTELNNPAGVDTFTIDSSTYAIITAVADDGVQMIDISDPTNILATDAVNDGDTDSNGDTFSMLDGARDVGIFTIDSSTSTSTYAIVTGLQDDGVQIIDISDPTNILATDAETDDNKDADSLFTELDLASGVDTFIINSVAYAIVLGYNDHGIQMIDLGNCASSDCVYTAASASVSTSTSGTCSRHVILGNCGTIAINNDVYQIIDPWSTVPTTEVIVGEPVSITLSTPHNYAAGKISSVSVYTEIFGSAADYEASTHIYYTMNGDIIISDHATEKQLFQIAGATHRIVQDTDVKNLEMFEVVFTMVFAKPMDTSHIVVETKNMHGIPETIYLSNALKVIERPIELLTYEEKSKFSIVDSEMEMDPEPEMEMDPEPEQTKKEKSKRQRR